MDSFYRIQIDSNYIPATGLQGKLGIAIEGTLRSTPAIYIQNYDIQSNTSISVFHQSRITIKALLPNVGKIQNLVVNYIGLFPDQRWYLKSITIVKESNGKYYYFPFNGWIQSQLKHQSRNLKRSSRREKFEIFKGKDKQHYFHLMAPNGEIIAASEGYKSRAGALNGIRSIKDNAASALIVNS